MRRNRGFTLIELMITVAIIAILGSIAIPAYSSYVTRGRIPEATSGLAAKRVKLEQCFQDNRTYANALCSVEDTTSSQYFDFTTAPGGAETRTATGYTISAVGKGPMAGFTYTVNQANARSTTITGVSGWSGNPNCWVTKTGGVC
jgi:type IV pilus assembly protein PilE